MSAAATRNVTTSATIAARRPKAWLNSPPRPAPTASITPQVDPSRALAARSSSGVRARLGTAASIAGLTKAARAATVPWKTNATQTRSSDEQQEPGRRRGLGEADHDEQALPIDAVDHRPGER